MLQLPYAIHHQWKPDILEIEAGISPDTVSLLIDRGQKIKFSQRSAGMGSLQTVMWKDEHSLVFLIPADQERERSGLTEKETNASSHD